MINLKNTVLACAIGASSIAAAADSSVNNKDYYAQLNSGISFGQKPKGDFSKGGLGNSGIYGFAVGSKIDDNFSAELSMDYRNGFENKYSTSEDNVNYNHSIKVKSLVTMVNGYYNFTDLDDNFTPYVTLGAGISNNKTNNYTINGTKTTTGKTSSEVYAKGSKTSFAYKFGLGSKYKINADFDLDLRYQYVDLGKFTTGGSNEDGTKATGKIKSHEIVAGIAYKF